MTTSSSPAAVAAANEGARPSIIKNASSLFVGQFVGLVIPLLSVPYLARVLGPDGWGPVIAAQALGNWLILVLEFGFDLSATRAVARARVDRDAMSAIVHGTQSAKTVLVPAAGLIVLAAYAAIPALRQNPSLVAWAFAYAVLRGFSPLWFFQGIERVQGAVAVDTIARAAAALGVFVAVRSPADGTRVVALQAIFAGLSLVVLTIWLGRHARLRVPTVADAVRTLRDAWRIFACRASSGLYIQANALILSAFAGAATVAFFGGAERIIRAAINMLQPLTQAVFPRISYLRTVDAVAAQRVIRRALVGIGAIGLAMGLVALFGAPLLVRVLLGAGYEAAVPVLRILAILPPLVAVNTVLAIYWAVPFGHERAFLYAIVAAGLANVALAIVLVPRLGATGMAASAIAAEVVVLGILGPLYARRRSVAS